MHLWLTLIQLLVSSYYVFTEFHYQSTYSAKLRIISSGSNLIQNIVRFLSTNLADHITSLTQKNIYPSLKKYLIYAHFWIRSQQINQIKRFIHSYPCCERRKPLKQSILPRLLSVLLFFNFIYQRMLNNTPYIRD